MISIYFSYFPFGIFIVKLKCSYSGSESEIDIFESIDKKRQEAEMVCFIFTLGGINVFGFIDDCCLI